MEASLTEALTADGEVHLADFYSSSGMCLCSSERAQGHPSLFIIHTMTVEMEITVRLFVYCTLLFASLFFFFFFFFLFNHSSKYCQYDRFHAYVYV